MGGGGLTQGLGIRLFAFGAACWPLTTAHSDPLWVRTCFGCVNHEPLDGVSCLTTPGVGGRGGFHRGQNNEGTFVQRAPGAPGIHINVPSIYPNALPPNITPSSSPGYLSPAVSRAQVWAEWLHYPCHLGGPQHEDKKWGKMGTPRENERKLCPARPER